MISDLQNGPFSNRKYPVRPPAPVAPGAAVAPTAATPRGSGEERTEKEAPLTPATATTLPYGCSENIAHGQAAAVVAVCRSARRYREAGERARGPRHHRFLACDEQFS